MGKPVAIVGASPLPSAAGKAVDYLTGTIEKLGARLAAPPVLIGSVPDLVQPGIDGEPDQVADSVIADLTTLLSALAKDVADHSA